jgi:hypothetical protein
MWPFTRKDRIEALRSERLYSRDYPGSRGVHFRPAWHRRADGEGAVVRLVVGGRFRPGRRRRDGLARRLFARAHWPFGRAPRRVGLPNPRRRPGAVLGLGSAHPLRQANRLSRVDPGGWRRLDPNGARGRGAALAYRRRSGRTVLRRRAPPDGPRARTPSGSLRRS